MAKIQPLSLSGTQALYRQILTVKKICIYSFPIFKAFICLLTKRQYLFYIKYKIYFHSKDKGYLKCLHFVCVSFIVYLECQGESGCKYSRSVLNYNVYIF